MRVKEIRDRTKSVVGKLEIWGLERERERERAAEMKG